MRERTIDFTWMRLAMAGLVLCLALLLAVISFMPAQAQPVCVAWDDHGNCLIWKERGISFSSNNAGESTATPAPTPQS